MHRCRRAPAFALALALPSTPTPTRSLNQLIEEVLTSLAKSHAYALVGCGHGAQAILQAATLTLTLALTLALNLALTPHPIPRLTLTPNPSPLTPHRSLLSLPVTLTLTTLQAVRQRPGLSNFVVVRTLFYLGALSPLTPSP